MDFAYSVNGVPIRLTDERWTHILDSHDDMAEYYEDCLRVIENPDAILRGKAGSLEAVKAYGRLGFLNVVYREISSEDGFIITAYFMKRVDRRRVLWRR